LPLPFGEGDEKFVKLGGKLFKNTIAHCFYNVFTPDFGQQWQISVTAVVVLTTSVFK
jgi:hypothetical protein